jgi:hypothetical protein
VKQSYNIFFSFSFCFLPCKKKIFIFFIYFFFSFLAKNIFPKIFVCERNFVVQVNMFARISSRIGLTLACYGSGFLVCVSRNIFENGCAELNRNERNGTVGRSRFRAAHFGCDLHVVVRDAALWPFQCLSLAIATFVVGHHWMKN